MKKILLLVILIAAGLFTGNSLLKAQPSIVVNGFHLDFGEVVLLQTYTADVMIINNGTEDLTVSDITFDSNGLSVLGETSFEINPSGFRNVSVQFTPSELGPFNATMSVESNADGQPVTQAPVLANVGVPVAEYLVVNNSQPETTLSWGGNGEDGSWLKYDSGVASSYVSFFTVSGQFVVASKWTAEAIANASGQFISRVAFYPTGVFSGFTIQIRSGENGQDILYEGVATQINYFEWNEYNLAQAIEVQEGQDYWIALQITQFGDMDASVAYDDQPAVDGFSNLILVNNEWQSMTTYGFHSNWMIRGFLSETATKTAMGVPVTGNHFTRASLDQEINMAANKAFTKDENYNESNFMLLKNAAEFILGYNIYRDGVLLNEQPITTSTFTDTNVQPGTYTYEVTIVFDGGEGEPISRLVHVASPELQIDPVSVILEEIGNTDVESQEITFVNTGLSTLEWEVADTLPFWLSLSSESGSIEPGSSASLTLTIEPDGLMAGIHKYNIKLITNNGNKPEYFLHVDIFVTGQTVLGLSGNDFHFGRVAIGRTSSIEIVLTNISDAMVYVTGPWYTPYTGFSSYLSTSGLQPGQTSRLIMSTWPQEIGLVEGEVELSYFNYQGSGKIRFPMSVEGFILQPVNLGASLDEEEQEVTLNWLTPGTITNELFFGNGIANKILPTSADMPISAAQRFTPEDLVFYNDRKLEQVGLAIAHAEADITVKIYTTENPEEPVYTLPVEDLQSFSWNFVTLPEPIKLDTIDYLWLTYELTPTLAGMSYVALTDSGPAVAGSGDLIKLADSPWTTLSVLGISRNFAIRGILSGDETKSGMEADAHGVKSTPNDFIGYRVYRNGELLNEQLLQENTFADVLDEEGGEFTYGVSAVFTYGESVPKEVTVSLPVTMSMPVGWNFNHTSVVHNIHIPHDVAQMGEKLSEGDMLGVFYHDADGFPRAAGATLWDGHSRVLVVYGNDPSTDIKDGLDVDDPLVWKVFRHETSLTHDVRVSYFDHLPNNDGTFAVMGNSMIFLLEVEEATVNVEETDFISVSVFPNPSDGFFTVNGLSEGERIIVYDVSGRVVFSDIASGTIHPMQLENSGAYIIEITRKNGQVKRIRQIIH